MSKSRGNLVFVSTLTQSGVNPMAIRCALLMQNYRVDRMWSEDLLYQSQTFLESLTLQLSQTECAPTDQVIQSIVYALANNLDTEEVFSILRQWIKQCQAGLTGGQPGELSRALDTLLGLAV
jgi:L-cysteine:1D-myo-inositol 2-amino-2-deoxy-alpha-D-glucopyranoside ligase